MVKPVPAPPKNANQRIADLERNVQALFENFAKLADSHNRLNGKVNDLGQITTALVNLGPGAQEVDAEIKVRQIEAAKGEAAAAKAAVTQGLADGKLERLEAVTTDCMIVGHEEVKQEDGSFIPAEVDYAVVSFDKLREDLQPKFLGQAVGARIPGSDTVDFVIEGVIRDVKPKAEETPASA